MPATYVRAGGPGSAAGVLSACGPGLAAGIPPDIIIAHGGYAAVLRRDKKERPRGGVALDMMCGSFT